MRSYLQQFSAAVAVLVAMGVAAPAQDLKITKKTTVGEASFSSETLLKGARERTAIQIAGAPATVTIRQCDLKRSVTVSDQSKAYLVANDPEDDSVNRAAALVSGDAGAPSVGGKVTVTSTVTDTGERKTLFGYPARHLKTTVVAASSPNACSPVNQKYQIDGWYIDLKDRAACKGFVPPVHSDAANCTDKVVTRQVGTAKPGFPINETITISNPDGPPTVVNSEVTALDKQTLAADLFDVPADYRQVQSRAELFTAAAAPATPVAQTAAPAQMTQASVPTANYANAAAAQAQAAAMGQMGHQGLMNPQAMMANQQAMMMLASAGQMGTGGMQTATPAPTGVAVASPTTLGPKGAGKMRIGIVSPHAQLGQGTGTQADYGTPIRNSMIQMMSGPAVEIAPLDSHLAMQVDAEARQKECDYILYSSVTVKHGQSGGFGKFMKMAGPAASMVPMMGAAGGMAGAVAASAAGTAMSTAASLSSEIKNKDEVTLDYQLMPVGQTTPKVANKLLAKAKSDGEDVLTPLIEQTATTVLTEVSKK